MRARRLFIISVFFVLCSPVVLTYGQTSSDSDTSYATCKASIERYCFIEFCGQAGVDFNPIIVEVKDGQASGETATRIKYGANFPFKLSAELGWIGSVPPGDWRVTLNENYNNDGWLTFGQWEDIGQWYEQFAVRFLGRWIRWQVLHNDRAWDVYPYGPPYNPAFAHVEPGRYGCEEGDQQKVTIEVQNIDLRTRADLYTGGYLTISIFPWL